MTHTESLGARKVLRSSGTAPPVSVDVDTRSDALSVKINRIIVVWTSEVQRDAESRINSVHLRIPYNEARSPGELVLP